MPDETILNQTQADLENQVVIVADGTPTAGQYGRFTSAYQSEGVAPAAVALELRTATPGGAGIVIQVEQTQTGAVATGSGTIPLDDSIPQISEGTEFLTVTLTPTDAANLLKVDVSIVLACNTAFRNVTVAAFKSGSTDAIGCATSPVPGDEAGWIRNVTFSCFVTAGVTTPVTISVRAGCETSGTITVNGTTGTRFMGGAFASTLCVTEVAA